MQRVGADAASEERASSGRMRDHSVEVVKEVGYGETMGKSMGGKEVLGAYNSKRDSSRVHCLDYFSHAPRECAI